MYMVLVEAELFGKMFLLPTDASGSMRTDPKFFYDFHNYEVARAAALSWLSRAGRAHIHEIFVVQHDPDSYDMVEYMDELMETYPVRFHIRLDHS